jgi:uncharacterized protein (DUF1778 family)
MREKTDVLTMRVSPNLKQMLKEAADADPGSSCLSKWLRLQARIGARLTIKKHETNDYSDE